MLLNSVSLDETKHDIVRNKYSSLGMAKVHWNKQSMSCVCRRESLSHHF